MHHKKWCQCCACYNQTLGLDYFDGMMDYYQTMEEHDNL